MTTRSSTANPPIGGDTNIRELAPDHVDYPERLRVAFNQLGQLAPTLWVAGERDLGEMLTSAVAMVGSRASTAYGEYVAAELGITLAGRGVTIISGGAYGIDAAAHRGALAASTAANVAHTIAVLGCGVDIAYPLGNAALFDRIAQTGLLVSLCPPGTRPARVRFLERNVVIAALAQAVVVVEAATRSGSLHTARVATELGRPVCAVPGPVTSQMSAGSNQLLKTGARCVTRASDVLDLLDAANDDAQMAGV